MFDNYVASEKILNLIAWVPIEQWQVRTPTIDKIIWTLLKVSSSVDRLCYTLVQKDLAVAQELIVNQHLLNAREANGPTRPVEEIQLDPISMWAK